MIAHKKDENNVRVFKSKGFLSRLKGHLKYIFNETPFRSQTTYFKHHPVNPSYTCIA